MTQVYWKGKLWPWDKVALSPLNTGLFYGENLFEAVPIYAGKPLFLREHLQRLSKGCSFLKWPFLPESEFQKAIRLFARDENSGKNFMIRFNLTQEMEGQVNPRLFLKRLPTLFATIRPLRHNPEDQYPIRGKVGISPWTAADNQTVPNWFKHSFYLTTRSVFRDHPDWDEILRLNHAGQVVDGGLSTPLWFNGKHVLAPPLRLGGLASVNREKMIALCRSLGIKVIEKAWKPQDVSRHGELFFVGSGIGVMSPTRLLGRKINKTNLMAVRFWHHYRSWALHKAII